MLQAALAYAGTFHADPHADPQLLMACMICLNPQSTSGYAGDSLKLLHVISDQRSPSTAGMHLRQSAA